MKQIEDGGLRSRQTRLAPHPVPVPCHRLLFLSEPPRPDLQQHTDSQMRLLFQEANLTGWIFSGHFWELLPFKLTISLSVKFQSSSGVPLGECGMWGALFPHQCCYSHPPAQETDTSCCLCAVKTSCHSPCGVVLPALGADPSGLLELSLLRPALTPVPTARRTSRSQKDWLLALAGDPSAPGFVPALCALGAARFGPREVRVRARRGQF